MQYRIEEATEKILIGKRLLMSYSKNRTAELWQSFMPQKNKIKSVQGNELYSVEVYPEGFFDSINMEQQFEKWAAVEVNDTNEIPPGMEKLIAPAGLYAIFHYIGSASEGMKAYQYIFNSWLPNSAYQLDDRPHFAVMGKKYKHDQADNSEEEIWIPVKLN